MLTAQPLFCTVFLLINHFWVVSCVYVPTIYTDLQCNIVEIFWVMTRLCFIIYLFLTIIFCGVVTMFRHEETSLFRVFKMSFWCLYIWHGPTPFVDWLIVVWPQHVILFLHIFTKLVFFLVIFRDPNNAYGYWIGLNDRAVEGGKGWLVATWWIL